MRDPNNFFTTEDEETKVSPGVVFAAESVTVSGYLTIDKANALIREALGPKVYTFPYEDKNVWATYQSPIDEQQAHLFCVKEIEK